MNELIDMLVYVLVVVAVTSIAFYILSCIIEFLISACSELVEAGKAINKWLKK